jgi:hypothetical protein
VTLDPLTLAPRGAGRASCDCADYRRPTAPAARPFSRFAAIVSVAHEAILAHEPATA